MVIHDNYPVVNDELGIYTPQQRWCYNKLLEIRYHIKHNRIYKGVSAQIEEIDDGIYFIEYSFNWEKSGNEVFSEQMAHAIFNICTN